MYNVSTSPQQAMAAATMQVQIYAALVEGTNEKKEKRRKLDLPLFEIQ